MAAVGEVADVNPKPERVPDDLEHVAFVGMSDLNEVTAVAVDREIRAYAEVSKGYTPFQRGDILMAKITPCFQNGKIGQAATSTQFAAGSTEFHVIRPRPQHLSDRYLLHFLRQPWVLELGELRMTGSGGQRRVPVRFLDELQIPLPPIEEQRRLAAVLDTADELRTKRRQAIAKLDILTQSIFRDMFGDPAMNPRGWPRLALGDVTERFSDGPFGSNLKSEHYVSDGVRVIRLQNIGAGAFLGEDAAFISREHFRNIAKHECRPGDVIIGTLGDPNLRACVQPAWLEVAVNKADCVQARVDPEVADPEWLCALLNIPSTEDMARSLVKGQTRSRISMGRLRELPVPVPPVGLQRAFRVRVGAVRHGQDAAHRSATRIDELFSSLQQRAFRGDL